MSNKIDKAVDHVSRILDKYVPGNISAMNSWDIVTKSVYSKENCGPSTGNMKKAISILEEHIKMYQNIADLYKTNPHNQAVTEYTAKEVKKHIMNLQTAVASLKNSGTGHSKEIGK